MNAPFTHHPRPSIGRRAGFTLVEILTVVVILGIASAIVIPQLSDRSDLRVAAGARVLMADLLYAQNRAIATQKTHWVKFDAEQQRYAIFTDSAMTDLLDHPVQKIPYVAQFSGSGDLAIPDVILVSATFGEGEVLGFDPLGQPMAMIDGSPVELDSNGIIDLRSGSITMRVTVGPFTGEINVAAVP